MDIFKIDENKSIILLENGGSQTTNKLNHPFNLPNENTYNENGKLEKEADLYNYILSFSHKLKSKKFTCSIDREIFINYHYENSKDKKKFLQVLENDVLSFAFIKRTVIVSEVHKWINSIHAIELSESKSVNGEKDRSEVDYEAMDVLELLEMFENRLGRLVLAYSYLLKGNKKMFSIMIDLAFSEETIGLTQLCNKLQKEVLRNDDVYLEKLLNVVMFNLNELKTELVFGNPDQYPKGDEIESSVIHELNQINVAEKLFFIDNCMFYDKSMKREPYIIKEVYYTQLKKQFDECTRVISELFKKRKIETVGYINTTESINPSIDIEEENLTTKLLIIKLLQDENLFPKVDTTVGETYLVYIRLIGFLLSKKEDSIKKAIVRADKILRNDDATKKNKSVRLEHLTKILPFFISTKHTSIQNRVEKLIESINDSK